METTQEPQRDYRGKLRSKYQTFNNEESKTVQSQAPQADIQEILRKYKEVGIIEHLNRTEATYKDVSEFEDFAAVMRHAKEAETAFFELPSKVREIFNHDVAQWLDAAHDPEKRQALVDAGHIDAPEVAERAPPVEPAGEPGGETGEETPE